MSIIGLISIGIIADLLALVALLWFGSQASNRKESRNEDAVGQALTPEGVAEAVRCLGYVPIMHDDRVEFRIDGQPYYIYTKDLPFMKLETKAIFENPIEESDYEFLIYATASVSEKKEHLIDITPTGIADRNIQCCIAALEPDRIYFRDSLRFYINLIQDSEGLVCDCFNKYIDEKYAFQDMLNQISEDSRLRKRPS